MLNVFKRKVKEYIGVLCYERLENTTEAMNALTQTWPKKMTALEEASLENTMRIFQLQGTLIPIETPGVSEDATIVTDYWTRHTVYDGAFFSAAQSARYMEERCGMHPQFRDYIRADDCHDGEVLLDYGCGPGHDLTWFSCKNNLKQIIGMDVSMTSLQKSQFRLALHGVPASRARLILADDASPSIALPDASVDFVNCQGVLMHTSFPEKILAEFRRVLRPEGRACIMVYNKSSVWYHLYAAYVLRFIDATPLLPLTQEEISAMGVDEIFRRSTDGVECPISRCYTPEEFSEMCRNAGFADVEYIGGYTNTLEPGIAQRYLDAALADVRLEEEHKAFLREVTLDQDGYPVLRANGMQCSIGGVYHLQ